MVDWPIRKMPETPGSLAYNFCELNNLCWCSIQTTSRMSIRWMLLCVCVWIVCLFVIDFRQYAPICLVVVSTMFALKTKYNQIERLHYMYTTRRALLNEYMHHRYYKFQLWPEALSKNEKKRINEARREFRQLLTNNL